MRDNQPHLLREMYLKGTLREHVVEKVQSTAPSYHRMIQQGVDDQTAKEYVLNVLAPAEGMEIEREEVISDEFFEKILEEVTRREDGKDADGS